MSMVQKWRKDSSNMKHFDLLKLILDESGFCMLKIKDLENENRLENLKELLRAGKIMITWVF